jgi:sugar O-acyltransferase (sialic acid O-acetyltransferase NeuD family)
MDEIILIGSGGHARSCIDVIEASGSFKIAGLVEKDKSSKNENLGYKIIGTDQDLSKLRLKYEYALITVGQIKSPKVRINLFNKLLKLDFKFPVIVSPKAYVSKHSKISKGTIIMHGVIINANALIGENCIINNKVLVEHDAKIADACHISTGAIINGGVSIGKKTFIGSGVVSKENISIGSNCIIGSGVSLKENVPNNQKIKT